MEKNSRIYIAGHRGLVGSAIHRVLIRQGYDNLLLRSHAELDLADPTATFQFFSEERPEYVFLAAAKVGGILANNSYPADFIRENLLIQTNAIDAAYRSGVSTAAFSRLQLHLPEVMSATHQGGISVERTARVDQSSLCDGKDRWYRDVLVV